MDKQCAASIIDTLTYISTNEDFQLCANRLNTIKALVIADTNFIHPHLMKRFNEIDVYLMEKFVTSVRSPIILANMNQLLSCINLVQSAYRRQTDIAKILVSLADGCLYKSIRTVTNRIRSMLKLEITVLSATLSGVETHLWEERLKLKEKMDELLASLTIQNNQALTKINELKEGRIALVDRLSAYTECINQNRQKLTDLENDVQLMKSIWADLAPVQSSVQGVALRHMKEDDLASLGLTKLESLARRKNDPDVGSIKHVLEHFEPMVQKLQKEAQEYVADDSVNSSDGNKYSNTLQDISSQITNALLEHRRLLDLLGNVEFNLREIQVKYREDCKKKREKILKEESRHSTLCRILQLVKYHLSTCQHCQLEKE